MAELRALLRELDVFAGELPVFDTRAAPDEPVGLFTEWLLHAVDRGVPEPHAMTLSTVGPDGAPSARVLLLKDVDAAGWRFATHRDSPKGRDLAHEARAALTFHWPTLARQVRVRGAVAAESPEASAGDFLARGAGARAEALLGRQSRPLPDPAVREAELAGARERLAREPGLVAPGWTLYTLRPERVEFWQGDRQRAHTRLSYRRADGGWTKELLWP
ncbi:pyridoxal 5'-phosphate synthase [Streptomyces capparidis]